MFNENELRRHSRTEEISIRCCRFRFSINISMGWQDCSFTFCGSLSSNKTLVFRITVFMFIIDPCCSLKKLELAKLTAHRQKRLQTAPNCRIEHKCSTRTEEH